VPGDRRDLQHSPMPSTSAGVFLVGTEPVTITDLWLRTKKADPRTSHSTVWRLLNALVECGLAHREISPADGIPRYGPVKIKCTHERVACRDCGTEVAKDGAGRSPKGGPYEPVETNGPEVDRLSMAAGIHAVVPKSKAATHLIAQAESLVARPAA
jgi:Ferric uptake regulator family